LEIRIRKGSEGVVGGLWMGSLGSMGEWGSGKRQRAIIIFLVGMVVKNNSLGSFFWRGTIGIRGDSFLVVFLYRESLLPTIYKEKFGKKSFRLRLVTVQQ
jgi:hypothetical protein